MVEYVDIVDEKDKVIGKSTKEEMYSKKLTHRIVHVFVLNSKKEIFFQKRSDKVVYLPGYYCTSAGGHVKSGESYEEAANRELREELGLDVELKKVARMPFFLNGQNRFIELFIAFADDGFNFKDGEVKSGVFLNLEDAYALVMKGDKIHPQLDLCLKWFYKNKDFI